MIVINGLILSFFAFTYYFKERFFDFDCFYRNLRSKKLDDFSNNLKISMILISNFYYPSLFFRYFNIFFVFFIINAIFLFKFIYFLKEIFC
jgi:hypothetical protein